MFKNFKKLFIAISAVSLIASCTKLDEQSESEISSPSSPAELLAVSGPAFAYMRDFAWSWYNLNEATTDECVVPTRGGDWGDGGNWKNMHLHTWSPTLGPIDELWADGFTGVGQCNRIIETFQGLPATTSRDNTIAEVRAARALDYFILLDGFGNVPIVSTFATAPAAPATSSRASVYAFVESELLAALPGLSADVTATTYGRMTQWVAKALLAKLYMNAGVYTGTPQWAKADAVITDIIASGKFSLSGDYASIFKPDNGPQIKETIFAIPFDANKATGINRNGMTMQMKNLHYPSSQKYNLPADPWNGFCTMATFYNKYTSTDRRNTQWDVGPQFRADGAPLLDGTYQVNYTPTLGDPGGNYDVVAGLGFNQGRSAGVRSVKYYPDSKSNAQNQNNDLIFLRYSDMLLLRAELFARGYTSTTVTAATALSAYNDVRGRAGLPANTANATLTEVYDERGRELAFEGWRRNDMIRFGKWESAFGFNTGYADVTRRLFPIPSTRTASNPNLTQNPGY